MYENLSMDFTALKIDVPYVFIVDFQEGTGKSQWSLIDLLKFTCALNIKH